MSHKIYQKSVALIASKKFFYVLIGLFILQTSWIALSGRYPMAFDEDFHLGIIRLYAHQWTPFFGHQPSGGDAFGALTRDPSYMYHYIMSFPYRLLERLFHSGFADVLVLRFFSIGFVALALVVFRKVLVYTKSSPPLINVVFLFFILTPLVPFESVQINYDNLLILLTGLCLLTTLRFRQELLDRHYLDITRLLLVLALCMFTSLIKYEFLPIFMGIFSYVCVVTWGYFKSQPQSARPFLQSILKGKRTVKSVAVATFFMVALGLFAQMYGYNMVKYKSPVPECDQVLSAQECEAYGTWARNDGYKHENVKVNKNPIVFSMRWGQTYFYSFFFEVNGIYSGFTVGDPLAIIYWTAVGIFWLGMFSLLFSARELLADSSLRLLGLLVTIYVLVLLVHNYTDYLSLGRHVAEQARYLLLLLLPMYCVLALAIRHTLVRVAPSLRLCFLLIVLLLFMQGGGVITYIVRTNPSWWWQNDTFPRRLNEPSQKILRPLMVDGYSNP